MIVGCRIESSEITLLVVRLRRKPPLLGNDIARAASFRCVDIYLVWTNKASYSFQFRNKNIMNKSVF